MADTVTLTIRGPLTSASLPDLYARTRVLLQVDGVATMRCELVDVAADAVAVDVLARLALVARRCGCRAQLCGASRELQALVELIGLADVLLG